MALNDAGRNAKTNGFAATATHAGLATADSAAAELSGGSPAYARKPIVWGASAAGTAEITNKPAFDVPGGPTTIAHLLYFTAATGGTYLGSRPLDSPQTFSTQGTYTLGGGTAPNPTESTGA